MNKIRLLLADDHSIVREGLKQLFALVTDIDVAAEAADGPQTLPAVKENDFDLVLMDLTMPGISGHDLISRLHMHAPHLPILVLSMHAEIQITRRALQSGAAGYLTKDCDPEMLLAAIRKVAAGGNFIAPVLAELMVFENAGSQGPLHASLSDRELQILHLLAKGKSINEIAAGLCISNKTVSTHKSRLMEKMGFANNADLVRYAVAHALVA